MTVKRWLLGTWLLCLFIVLCWPAPTHVEDNRDLTPFQYILVIVILGGIAGYFAWLLKTDKNHEISKNN